MNNDFEDLKLRLQNADPSKTQTSSISENVLKVGDSKPKRVFSYRPARFAGFVAAGAFALALSLALPAALTPAPLIQLSSNSGQPMAASAEAGDAKVGMIWPGWIQYNYIAEGLSEETGRGKVYQLQISGDPVERLETLAKFFGVTGEVKEDEWSTKEYPSYSISGKNLMLSIYWSGTGSWSYSKWADFKCEAVEPSTEGETTASDCTWPEPDINNIPSKEAMRATAIELFTAMGFKGDFANLRVDRSEWGGSVSIPEQVAGQDIAVEWSVGWDQFGELAWASGHSFEVVERGEFGTISAKDAVARIADGRWGGSAPFSLYNSMPMVRTAEASPDMATSSEVEPAPEEKPAEEPTPTATEEPAPVPTEPEIVDLIVNKSEEAMLTIWDTSGSVWVVPGYLLYNTEGWFSAIISLVEGVIALPDPVDYGIEPMPVEDVPSEK